MIRRLALVAALTLAALPALAGAQEQSQEAFSWNGTIPQGRWLYVRNMNGVIRVDRASGGQAEVRGRLRSRGSADPKDVRFVTQKAADGQSIVICALWGERTSCDENGYRGDYNNRNGEDWSSVEFTVRIPQGVKLEVTSVNGGLEVRGATSEVVARTVNGSVRAETEGGPVSARTVNGSIDARMSTVGDARDLSFESVNGSVSVAMPQSLGAEVELSTVNGRVNTEFPITISGRIDPKRLRATIGDGSRRVRMKTVNGSVTLRRAD
jgi:hypothetical protein